MKSLLKFTLLAALIIGGKIAKKNDTAPIAGNVSTKTTPYAPVVRERGVQPLTPVKVSQRKPQPEQQPVESGLIIDMF